MAGTALLRSVLAAVFPLFTPHMYNSLGIHLASTIPAILALVFAPFPFILYKYGPAIRLRCKYSAEAVAFMKDLQAHSQQPQRDAEQVMEESMEVIEHEDRVVADSNSEKYERK
jgi:hypothetical protein